jgi:hypothetical protein
VKFQEEGASVIKIDRAAAEDIIKAKLIKEGKARLSVLNDEFMLALESGNPTKEIVSRKNAVRHIANKDLSGLSIAELAVLTLDAALAL